MRVGGKWLRGLEFLWGTAEGWGEKQPWRQGQWGTQKDVSGGFQLSPEGTEVFSLPLSTCGPSRRAFPPGLGWGGGSAGPQEPSEGLQVLPRGSPGVTDSHPPDGGINRLEANNPHEDKKR